MIKDDGQVSAESVGLRNSLYRRRHESYMKTMIKEQGDVMRTEDKGSGDGCW